MSGRVLAMRGNSVGEALSNVGNRQAHIVTLAVLAAIEALGLPNQELAKHLRVSPAQFSRQIANKDGHYLQVQRFDVLPADLHAKFVAALVEELARATGRAIVSRDPHLAQLAKVMRSMGDAMDALSVRQSAEPELPLLAAAGGDR
jgi:hypothetical protein